MLLKTRRIDISLLDYEELLDLRLELTEENTMIKLALSKARRRYEIYKEVADPDWYEQNKEQHKLLILDIDKIGVQITKLRYRRAEANKLTNNSGVYKKFYEEAAALLPAELFSKIVEEVEA